MTVSGGGAVGAGLGLSLDGGAVSANALRVGRVVSRAARRKFFIGRFVKMIFCWRGGKWVGRFSVSGVYRGLSSVVDGIR